MPLTYHRDDARRLVVVTATDDPAPFVLDDIFAAITRQWAEETWHYAIVYDYRDTTQVLTQEQLEGVAAHVRLTSQGMKRGPVACLSMRPEMVGSHLTYAGRVRDIQSFDVLVSEEQWQEWLERRAPLVT